MLTGIININKSRGCTSHDVVNQIRKIFKTKKVGHTGTLDPAATGVLAICIGKATKLIQYLPTDKQYIAEITLGITTSTYDSDGEITGQNKVNFNKNELTEALKNFSGEIIQQVPLASATHYQGKKLYEYAHKGIIIEDLPSKKVNIYNIEIINIQDNLDNPVIKARIDCGGGTYIRSIANDLGKILGYGAYLSSLERTVSSALRIEDSYSIEYLKELSEKGNLSSIVLSPTDIIDIPKYQLNTESITKIKNGQYISLLSLSFYQNQKLLLLDENNQIVAVAEYIKERALIKPLIVWN